MQYKPSHQDLVHALLHSLLIPVAHWLPRQGSHSAPTGPEDAPQDALPSRPSPAWLPQLPPSSPSLMLHADVTPAINSAWLINLMGTAGTTLCI